MEKVRLGRTGLTITRLGWGGIPIQRLEDEGSAVSLVRAVVEMGVDLLDTGRPYTNSEYRIGLALKEIKKPVVLSSKSPGRTGKIYNEVQESLKQLQVKKIDIYHLHNIAKFDDYEKVMGSGGAYEGLRRAKQDGLIDHIGLTSHNLSILEKALHDGYFDVIMACYSFLEPEAAQKIFPLAAQKDVGVLVMKPFSGGVIEEAGPALRFVFSIPQIVPIPGAETIQKARENWRVFAEGRPLSEQDEARIMVLKQENERQFCRRCDYCQPCSQEINIQFVVGLKHIAKRFGLQNPLTKRYIEMGRKCIECGDCLPRCPYQLPIPEIIKENLAWVDSLQK